ncbi:uncharacterized protein BDV17DRAFT_292775 [Aspergillus undulatus]|uniref:uncharacterized protein n=1 Tax=Aspergillus undulatus TaxID=1810928 RepID=UPI003CCD1D02
MYTLTLASLFLSITRSATESARLFGFYRRHYGRVGGTILQVFGSSTVWKTQLRVLTSSKVDGDERTAADFRNAHQGESEMVAIAGTILAQIAITAFGLADVEHVHWTARGCFAVSLVSSIISVYYASKQHRILGRCLGADDVKRWIRGPGQFPSRRKNTKSSITSTSNLESDSPWLENELQEQVPSIAAVLTISAPVALLSTAVYAFLAGLGVYLGFIWKSNLGESLRGDNLAIFVTYTVALLVCHSLYALSRIAVAEQVDDGEIGMLLERTRGWGRSNGPEGQLGHLEVAEGWKRADVADSGSGSASRGPSRNDGKASELQLAFLEAARLRREMAAVDEKIAVLLEGLGRTGAGE